MSTIDQPTAAPSNKVTAAVLGSAISAAAYAYVAHKWPVFKDPEIWMPLAPALSALFAFVPGYLKREASDLTKRFDGNRGWWVLGGGLIAVAGALGFAAWAF